MAWNNVAASIYGLSATAVYDAGSTVVSPSTTVSVTNLIASADLSFASTSGTISAPFYITNGAIAQPAYTGVTAGGQAVYTFNISAAGHYTVSVSVNAASQDYNSLFLNIDAQPTDPTMIWDIPVTTGFTSKTVSWRGTDRPVCAKSLQLVGWRSPVDYSRPGKQPPTRNDHHRTDLVARQLKEHAY